MDGASYLSRAVTYFEAVRRHAERALAQIDDARFSCRIDPESNSLALIVKHLAGNLASRWTGFLTTDGEKPTRRRDAEFEEEAADARAGLMKRWDEGWAALLTTLRSLRPADLDCDVLIRGEPLSVVDAIERQKEHYAYHVGQIVFLAKHLLGADWRSLSIPRGQSEQFHAERRARGERRGFR
jgi:hypothetical protein